MKRGELSIGIIVGLAIALIVLLLLLTLFTTRFSIFGKKTGELQTGTEAQLCARQGSCRAGDNPCPGKSIMPPAQGWVDCTATCCRS